MHVAIVGSRSWADAPRVREFVRKLAAKYPDAVVVSGGCRGVDLFAEHAAREFGLETLIFPADWERFGRSAGYKRNVTIVEHSDVVVAFKVPGSKGTQHTINIAAERGVPVHEYGP